MNFVYLVLYLSIVFIRPEKEIDSVIIIANYNSTEKEVIRKKINHLSFGNILFLHSNNCNLEHFIKSDKIRSSLLILINLSHHLQELIYNIYNSFIISYSTYSLDHPSFKVRDNVFRLDTSYELYIESLFMILKENQFNWKHGLNVFVQSDLMYSSEIMNLFKRNYGKHFNGKNIFNHLNIVIIQSNWNDYKIGIEMAIMSHSANQIIFIHCNNKLSRKIFKINDEHQFFGNENIIILTDFVMPNKEIKNYDISKMNVFYLKGLYSLSAIEVFDNYNIVIKKISQVLIKKCNYSVLKLCKKSIIQEFSNLFTNNKEYKFNKIILFKLYQQDNNITWLKCAEYLGNAVILKNLVCHNSYYKKKAIYKKIMVAIIPTEPFIKIDESFQAFINSDSENPDCGHNVPCYEVPNKTTLIYNLYDHIKYQKNNIKNNKKQLIRCCYGFSITLVQKLAMDLNYDLTFYIVNSHSYGHFTNNQWDGMVRDLKDNVAHIGTGAFSITADREKVIDMSDPYYTSDIEILSVVNNQEGFLGAVFKPFTLELWILICVTATISAIAMAIFEWNSPYGLNPWGRKRERNYTIASALNSVYAIMFGHTIKTKAPKSWPVKWVQNIWAYGCIIIVAMYTANLTVFITGVNLSNTNTELKVGNNQIAIINNTNIIQSLIDLNDKRYPVQNWNIRYLNSYQEAEELFINKSIGIIIDESLIIRKLKQRLLLCGIMTRKINIGPIGYGFGFPKKSKIKDAIINRLRIYSDFGFFDLLEKSITINNNECQKSKVLNDIDKLKVDQKGYRIENMAGLFLALAVGFLIAFFILFLEHMLYWWIIPRWHNLPKESYWKSINIMLLSQRLYRIIHSDTLIKPKDTTKEMIEIVKNLEFGKVFFKENLQKPIKSRRSSEKITVFDISSEMVKIKKQSQSNEHIKSSKRSFTESFTKKSKSYEQFQYINKISPKRLFSYNQSKIIKFCADDKSSPNTLVGSKNNSLRIALNNPFQQILSSESN